MQCDSPFGDITVHDVCCSTCRPRLHANQYGVGILANETAIHAGPTYLNLFLNSVLKGLQGNSRYHTKERDGGLSIPTELKVSNHPFPWPKGSKDLISTAFALFLTIIVTIALAFVPPTFALFIVREKEFKQRHQQGVSGLNPMVYWTSNFIWDFASQGAVLILTVILFACFGVEGFVDSVPAFGAFCLTMFLYCLASIPFTYVFTFAFKEHTAAHLSLIGITLMSGVVLILIAFIMEFSADTKAANYYMTYIYRIFPAFNMGYAILQLAKLSGFNKANAVLQMNVFEVEQPTDWNITACGNVYMASEFVLYAILVVLLETRIICLSFGRCGRGTNKGDPASPLPLGDDEIEIDEDVLRERERVVAAGSDLESATHACDDVVQVRDVHKTYGFGKNAKKAVQGISFGIDVGTCFGLLGINGAGKTSTFGMLTGEFAPTRGELIIDGHDVVKEPETIKRLLGYCPQFDAIWDKLTAREHLRLYGHIKGIPEDRLEDEVNIILNRMGLESGGFSDKLAGGFSGGNKRKLSVGIALIGNPKIVFLDEPSTGMDPVARRQMWGIISQVTTGDKSCCTILTTHSMEECEALCTRICIMVAGRLKCIGPGQHLKARFGKSFSLEVVLRLPSESQVAALQQELTDLAEQHPDSPSGNALLSKKPEPEVEMSFTSAASGLASGGSRKSYGELASESEAKHDEIVRTISATTSLQHLFESTHADEGGRTLADMLVDNLAIDTRFPAFRERMRQVPNGGLIEGMSSREAAIFIMEQDRMWRIKAFMMDQFQGAVIKEELSNSLRYSIPDVDEQGARRQLADIFEKIESYKDELCMENYAVGQMTLEQIFNSFAAQQDNPDNARYQQQKGSVVE